MKHIKLIENNVAYLFVFVKKKTKKYIKTDTCPYFLFLFSRQKTEMEIKEIWGTGRDPVNPDDAAEMGAGSDYSGNEMNMLRIRENDRIGFSLIVSRICAARGHTGFAPKPPFWT